MTLEQAKDILKDNIEADGGLDNLGWYLCWEPGSDVVTLDGEFTLQELEAISLYVRHVNDEKTG